MSISSGGITSFSEIVGQLYGQWTLDGLTELAYAISQDVINRPQLYRSEDIPDEITALRMCYGSGANYPNASQREAMMSPVLGQSDGLLVARTPSPSPFDIARKRFLDAVADFAGRIPNAESSVLGESVRSSATLLRSHFEAVRGKSLSMTTHRIDSLFDLATSILKTPGVFRVFGIQQIEAGWPLKSGDLEGAKFIENVGATLFLAGESRLSFANFVLLQQAAQEGAQTIRLLLSDEEISEQYNHELVSRAFRWHIALRELRNFSQPKVSQPRLKLPQMMQSRLQPLDKGQNKAELQLSSILAAARARALAPKQRPISVGASSLTPPKRPVAPTSAPSIPPPAGAPLMGPSVSIQSKNR